MGIHSKESFERWCRLCAEEQEVTIMIFSAEAEAMLLQNKLNKYLLIEVDEDDRLPKNICIKCCTKLQMVCEFIDKARNAQEILQNHSIVLDQISRENSIKSEPKYESDNVSDDETKHMSMEVSVDPMMVLQNADGSLSPSADENFESNIEDVIYLHGEDGENVTIKLIKRGESKPSDSSDERKDSSIKPFPCITCNRSFLTELALKNHSWIHFNEGKMSKQYVYETVTPNRTMSTLGCENQPVPPPTAVYMCDSCKEGFDYKSDLIAHVKQHRTSGTCHLCGRVNEANLNSHMAVHMSKGKSYTCKVCGRSYNTKSNLKTHSITHSNERPYQCHVCKKSFKRNQDLKFHINQHTGEKPYKCPFCEKSFASSGNCYSHRSRMHPGQHFDGKVRRQNTVRDTTALKLRPIAPKSALTVVKGIFKYQCQLCDHSFVRRENYTYHMYQHTGEKPFQCTICPEKFVTRRGLLLHHDKEHPTMDRPLALLSRNALLK